MDEKEMLKWLTKENAKLIMDKARAKEIMVDQLDKWNQTQGLMVEIAKDVKRMREEIESLKNCANCRHIIWGDDELLCTKNWVGDKMDKCDHWQKL